MDEQFDFAYSECVMNLVPDREKVISEAYRVLESGGLFVYTDFVSFKPVTDEVREHEGLVCGCRGGSLSLSENVRILEKQGFRNIECIDYSIDKDERDKRLRSEHDSIKEEHQKLVQESPEVAKFIDEELGYYLIVAKNKIGVIFVKTLLVSNFEGGFQPHTVASAATALINAGVEVSVLDTYVEGIQKEKFKDVDLVAISIPLFDAVSAGIEISKMVREENPNAHITFFGQHATINANRLSGIYSDSCISGEWEIPLVKLTDLLAGEKVEDLSGILLAEDALQGKVIHPFMSRKHLDVPTRTILPPLEKYPQIQINKLLGSEQVVGTTEIARGCHHKCLYCSVFAAYDGKVILVPEDIVISDVRNLVNQGMTHLTFIDADFLMQSTMELKF